MRIIHCIIGALWLTAICYGAYFYAYPWMLKELGAGSILAMAAICFVLLLIAGVGDL